MATWEVEVMYFLLNITYIYPIFILYFHPIKIIFSYITFVIFTVYWHQFFVIRVNFSITIQPMLTIFHPCIDHGGYMSPDLDLIFTWPSWSWSYGSWICLCKQCLLHLPLNLWVRTTFIGWDVLDTTLCDLRQVGGFLRLLQVPLPIKLTASI